MPYTIEKAQSVVRQNQPVIGRPLLDSTGSIIILAQYLLIIPSDENLLANIKDIISLCKVNNFDNLLAIADFDQMKKKSSTEFEVYAYGEKSGMILYREIKSFCNDLKKTIAMRRPVIPSRNRHRNK